MITSTANSRMKEILKLHKSAKERKKTDAFIVEGPRMVREIPDAQLISLYVAESFFAEHQKLFDGKPYELVADKVFQTLSDTLTPQGVLAVVRQRHFALEELLSAEHPLLLLLENIQDPGNLGTILRTAEGAGVHGVIASRNTVDIYNSKVVRSTMGAIFRVPFLVAESLPETAENLRRKGITVLAAHIEGDSIYDRDYAHGTAFCVGNEGNGLTAELLHACDGVVTIPMKGKVESLNAAAAATVLCYEALRQRL